MNYSLTPGGAPDILMCVRYLHDAVLMPNGVAPYASVQLVAPVRRAGDGCLCFIHHPCSEVGPSCCGTADAEVNEIGSVT
jgi:hypothetical protein